MKDAQTELQERQQGAAWAAALTDEALAHRLGVMNETPRAYSAGERFGMVHEAARRLRGDRQPGFRHLDGTVQA